MNTQLLIFSNTWRGHGLCTGYTSHFTIETRPMTSLSSLLNMSKAIKFLPLALLQSSLSLASKTVIRHGSFRQRSFASSARTPAGMIPILSKNAAPRSSWEPRLFCLAILYWSCSSCWALCELDTFPSELHRSLTLTSHKPSRPLLPYIVLGSFLQTPKGI